MKYDLISSNIKEVKILNEIYLFAEAAIYQVGAMFLAGANSIYQKEIFLTERNHYGVLLVIKELENFFEDKTLKIEKAKNTVQNPFDLEKANKNHGMKISGLPVCFFNYVLYIEKHLCVFSAVSFSLAGNIHLKNILRLLSLLEVLKNPENYQSKLEAEFNRFLLILILGSDFETFTSDKSDSMISIKGLSYNNSFSPDETSKEICKNSKFLEVVLQIIAALVGQNIIVYEIGEENEERVLHKLCLRHDFVRRCWSEFGRKNEHSNDNAQSKAIDSQIHCQNNDNRNCRCKFFRGGDFTSNFLTLVRHESSFLAFKSNYQTSYPRTKPDEQSAHTCFKSYQLFRQPCSIDYLGDVIICN